MSLEDSMNTLAESNNRLAAAMTKYATVMEGHLHATTGTAVDTSSDAGDAGASTADKPTRKRRTQAEIAAAAKAEADELAGKGDAQAEIDPFADEEPAPAAKKLTKDDIRTLVLGVKEKDESFAKKLLEKLGVKTLGTIEEKDYPKVVELAAKVGVTL